MTMGERIRQARIEAGLSQRQLAGEVMTRNMLSALEHDGANPSIATLKYLSEKLCKPIGYFLGEEVPRIPELEEMERARNWFSLREYGKCLKELEELHYEAFQAERSLLRTVCYLELAEQARIEGKMLYSKSLLEKCASAMENGVYLKQVLERRWLISSALVAQDRERLVLTAKIAPEDEVLLLCAAREMELGALGKAAALLEAAENQKTAWWNYLRGELYFRQQVYDMAAKYYHSCEEQLPERVLQRLEICYREQGDYKMAYYYAKKEK